MKQRATTEAELAAIVIAWLEALGAEVYQEVECASGVADIVARVGPELWIVETKLSLSLALLVQACERRREAHRVYCAGPYTRTMRDFELLVRELGVGLLDVRVGSPGCDAGSGYGMPAVQLRVQSRRWNARPVALAGKLRPEHKTAQAAGSVGGGRWTPFRDTCQQLRRIVETEPGITLKEAIEQTTHHYRSAASARSSMLHWIEAGKVEGVSLVRGAQTTLHPTRSAPR